MVKKQKIRKRGKLQLSRYFQKLKQGDAVAVVREKSLELNFPERLQGRTGVVAGKQGQAYVVKVKDCEKEKQFLIKPIHLKKIKQIKVK